MSTPGDTSATFCATLVDEWVRCGVQHAVVAPGSRSTPLAVALSRRDEISLQIFHDERSASFAALGIGLETGVPAILLCTSGTAAAHFHGAVAEADLSNVPMVVCTADRPPELRDVGAPQTIDQTKMFGSMVRWFHDPGVPSEDAKHSWRSLASRLVEGSSGARPGPVHVNLPFREPLLGTPGELPDGRRSAIGASDFGTQSSTHFLASVARDVSGKRGVFVAGRYTTPEVLDLAKSLGWPVLADARSGVRVNDEHVVLHSDAILRSAQFAAEVTPDFVIRIGEPPASKVTNQWVANSGARIIQMLPFDYVIDPDHQVETRIVGDIAHSLSQLASQVNSIDGSWLAQWASADSIARECINAWCIQNDNEISRARAVTSALKENERLMVSSSMPIRDVEWFGATTKNVVVYSNRGANGIDGVMSTAIGVAVASQRKTVVYIGDVAALHDSTSLISLMQRNIEMKVVISNNDGGSIFSFLPQATQVDEKTFEALYGTPHGVSFASLAQAYGIPYAGANSSSELTDALAAPGTLIIELKSARGVNVSQHSELNALIMDALQNTK